MRIFLLSVFIVVALTACGPRARISPTFSSSSSRIVALLPAEYPSGVQRERVDYIRSLVRNELQNAGYVLLEDAKVSPLCGSSACCSHDQSENAGDNRTCSERAKLRALYGVTTFASIHIESVARNNFIAGYLNAIDGSLELSDQSGNEIAHVKNTESERGGLLFNSGQLIQGVVSQIDNAGEDQSFQRLASKFVQSLVSQIPRVDPNLAPVPQTKVAIQAIEVHEVKPPFLQVCLNGTPGSTAVLIVNRQRSNLRETSAGSYCGVYNVADLAPSSGAIEAELRSVFGETVRQEVRDIKIEPCNLNELVQLVSLKEHPEVIVQSRAEISPDRFWIYRSENKGSSFEKVADTTSFSWVDSRASLQSKPLYQVVCVDKQGIPSLPEPARHSNQGNT